jgi:CRP-like cAMP-binding protein
MQLLNRDLTKNAEKYFREQGIKISHKKGQIFDRPEDTLQGIYFMDRGQVLFYHLSGEGYEHLIGVFEEGSIFSKAGSIHVQPVTPLYLESLTDCVIYRLDVDKFMSLLENNREFLLAYLSQVSYNNVFLLKLLLVVGEKDIYLRIVKWLQLMSIYYGDATDDKCVLRMRLSHQQIANCLRITREYLGKGLKEVKKNGLVVMDDHQIIIPSLKALSKVE